MTHESGSNATPESGGAEVDAPNIASESAIDGAKGKRKDMEPRAPAWNHFTKLKGVDGRTRGKCNGCGKVFLADSKSNGTSSLNYHMSRCKHIKKVEGTSQSQLSFTIASGGECEVERIGTLGSWKFEQQASRNKLAKMVVIDELPFKYVENAGFREFVASLQPRFRVPSRWTVARDCYDLFIDEKAKLKTFIKNSCDRVCLTTDTWTSLQRINYMCLTVHFIDMEWKLHKKILSFRPINSHKGDSIARAIERCLVEWGVSNVFTITVDNASSNDQAMKNLQKKMANKDGSILKARYLHMRCMAHIINLIVQDGLKEMNISIERVRGAIKYVRHSPSRIARFRECIEMEKIECKKFLCLDVSTRWNSTYLMLESAQRFIPAFERYIDLDQMYAAELQAGKGVPQNDDWEKVKKFVIFLKHFYDLTLRISGTSYVTSNQIFNDISSVHCLLDQWKNSLDLEISLMGDAMKLKFDKYWGDFGKMNMVIYIAVALDPRFKMEYVEYVLKTMQPGQVGDKMVNDVRAATFDMLADYQKKFSSSSGQSVDKSQALNTLAQEEASESFTNVYLSSFKRFRSEIKDENRTELDKYLSEGIEDATADFDILGWWKLSASRYPILSKMARDVLAIPASTVASESAFSAGGRVLDPYRTSLTPRMVQALICTKDWLTGEPICSYLEEDTEAIEKLEEGIHMVVINCIRVVAMHLCILE